MNVAVVIPWRAMPARRWGFRQVVNFYKTEFPEYTIYPVDSTDPLFNLAAARNFGVKHAEAHGADVVIVTDADTLPEPKNIALAVQMAYQSPGTVLPYTEYRSLMLEGTKQYARGICELKDCIHMPIKSACSGVYIQTPQSWATHYGQDIRFRGWGYEDSAWKCAHETLIGPVRRVPGNVYAFHHPSQEKAGKQFVLNAALCHHYLLAQGDPDAMTHIITNRREPMEIPGMVVDSND